jgi:ribosome-associated protein
MTPQAMAELAVSTLDENKGLDIKCMDVRENTDVTDFIVICTATSTRHAQSLMDKVQRQLRDEGIRALGTEGSAQNDDWVLVDFGDIVVHIMLAEAREFYSLEKLWAFTEERREKAIGED